MQLQINWQTVPGLRTCLRPRLSTRWSRAVSVPLCPPRLTQHSQDTRPGRTSLFFLLCTKLLIYFQLWEQSSTESRAPCEPAPGYTRRISVCYLSHRDGAPLFRSCPQLTSRESHFWGPPLLHLGMPDANATYLSHRED